MTANAHAAAGRVGMLAADDVLAGSSGTVHLHGEPGGHGVVVHTAVMTNWVKTLTAWAGLRCPGDILQRPGSAVVQVSFGKPCNAGAASRNVRERTVRRASPLLLAGFEHPFQRRINPVFKYHGH